MITLYDSATGSEAGTLSDEQFKQLSDQLEEEWSGDEDYYISADTIDVLQEAGVSGAVLDVLRRVLNGREEADIRWKKS